MTGLLVSTGNLIVPFFTQTGTTGVRPGSREDNQVEQTPCLGALILVVYFTTATRR